MAKWKVLTPKTTFQARIKQPDTHEAAIQEAVGFNDLYQWQHSRQTDKVFTLHDGPPYANGVPHMGHVLNKVLKDFINRYKVLKGFKVHYRPGWDCHGLPIELKACQGLSRDSSPLEVRKTAKEFAEKAIELQRKSFQRWGLLADWSNPYLTMSKEYETNQIDVFYRMYERGCIYRRLKPVYWSPSSRTALAEAELEYHQHKSRSVYVLFPSCFPSLPQLDTVHSLVWTTTPWTLPANQAICYHPDHQYSFIKQSHSNKILLLGTEQLPQLQSCLGTHQVLDTVTGASLAGGTYTSSIDDTSTCRPFLPGTHVSPNEGTGLVHTAPTHGFDDYSVGLEHNMDLNCLVDGDGCYGEEAGQLLAGLDVLTSGNDKVIAQLESNQSLFHINEYDHRYPYDWRTNKPVIIRCTKQWFSSVESLRERGIEVLQDVNAIPNNAITILESMLRSRADWCISRQRVWGVPIPVFFSDDGDTLINEQTVSHIKTLFLKHGSDCWWNLPVSQLLPPSLREKADSYDKGSDTMDVWFDSGSSWKTVLGETGGVADMYLEGIDQYRGWFQSSLLTSVAVQGCSPYRQLVSHGFVLDMEGKKMSKSIGNVITPDDIIDNRKLGADVMRMWVSSSDFKSDVAISYDILDEKNQFYVKLRLTLRFMIGNLIRFDAVKELVPYTSLSFVDRYQLHLLSEYFTLADISYENLNFLKVYNALLTFIPQDISAYYYELIKDRLYCDQLNSASRKCSLTVLHHLLKYITLSLAPLVPYLAEEVNMYYPFVEGQFIYLCTVNEESLCCKILALRI